MKKTVIRRVDVPLQATGVCTAAGGLKESVASLSADGGLLGPGLLEAWDVAGDQVSGLAAAPNVDRGEHLVYSRRLLPMLQAAAQDLARNAGIALTSLVGERLFVLAPESAPRGGGDVLVQAWMALHGADDERSQRSLRERISVHEDIFETLAVAAASLGIDGKPQASALVLCGESWLTHEALAWLDDEDLLRCPSSGGVMPGEAVVLLRLSKAAAVVVRCAVLVEAADRHCNDRPLGTPISEAVLALQGDRRANTVIADAHPNQRSFVRESEFLRRRHWEHLAADGLAWMRGAAFGYVGHACALLQLATLAQLPPGQLPALGYARSLWRQGFVCARVGDEL